MRRAVLMLDDILLTDFLKGLIGDGEYSLRVTKNSLPKDAKVIRGGHDDTGTLRILLESDEFEDIADGNKYPILDCPCIERKAYGT